MPRKKPSSSIYVLIGVFVLLLVAQVAIRMTRPEVKPFTEALDEKLSARDDIDSRRKDLMKVQLSVRDWMVKNGNTPPNTLAALVPEYFPSIPIDPATGKPFSYSVDGKIFRVGQEGNKLSQPDKGAPEALTAEEEAETQLVAMLDEEPEEFVYDPAEKRDPFAPFNFAPEIDTEGKTELEQFSIGQLRLTAVLEGFGDPKAIVESSTGKGFTVRLGTHIGQKNGVVTEILPNKLVIVETETSFTGETKTNTVELKLRIPGQQK
ncbi:MAG: pilus assembly protein PilP [Bdellovibrionales bacterium]|nr:pilus assembly protein PilP [Bdellovibrionales bacterium]